MDSEPSSTVKAYLKSHPFIPISICLSAAGMLLGAYSLMHSVVPSASIDTTVSDLEMPITLAVDVEGEVVRPGILELDAGGGKALRVSDAIAAAGGFTASADAEFISKNMNLAAGLKDGMKLYVPRQGEKTTQNTSGKTNINTASQSELEQLKGIGQTRAKAIIENRPFTDLSELGGKAKLPASVLEGIKDEVVF